jgi:hypothetical protein
MQQGSFIGPQVQTGLNLSVSANISFVIIYAGNGVWQWIACNALTIPFGGFNILFCFPYGYLRAYRLSAPSLLMQRGALTMSSCAVDHRLVGTSVVPPRSYANLHDCYYTYWALWGVGGSGGSVLKRAWMMEGLDVSLVIDLFACHLCFFSTPSNFAFYPRFFCTHGT